MSAVMFVCSGGGHLTELLEITGAFTGRETVLVSYPVPAPEGIFSRRHAVEPPVNILRIALLFITAFRLLRAERPAVIVSAGSEITIPFFLLGKLFGAKLVYLESCAQVYTLSITGRIVYPIADLFLVQWKQLEGKRFRRARYAGGLI